MPIILKRGTESNRPSLFLRVGEPIFTTDSRRLYIGSGASDGGKELTFGQLTASLVSASKLTVGEITASKIVAVDFQAQIASMSLDHLEVTSTINATCSQALTASYLIGSIQSASYSETASWYIGNQLGVGTQYPIDTFGIVGGMTLQGTGSRKLWWLNPDFTTSGLIQVLQYPDGQHAFECIMYDTASGVSTGRFVQNSRGFSQRGNGDLLSTDDGANMFYPWVGSSAVTSSGLLVQRQAKPARSTLLSVGGATTGSGYYTVAIASGTYSSIGPTLGGQFGSWQVQTYGGSTWSTSARMMMQTSGDHNEGSRPTDIIFQSTPSGSTTLQTRLKVNGSGVQVTGSLGVNGTITTPAINVQTLVVTTISSSVEYVSGSTIHGSLMTNTHQFTGSLGVTGSMTVMGGNVGIGTSTPGAKLDVYNATGNVYSGTRSSATNLDAASYYYDGTNAVYAGLFGGNGGGTTGNYGIHNGGVRMVVAKDGNVGIGTTSPAARLDLGASTGVVQYIYKDGSANAGLGINLSGGSGELSLFAGATGDGAGRISFGRRRVDTETYTERMVIDAAAGNVGIGTSSPAAQLHLRSASANIAEAIRLDNPTNIGGNGSKIVWRNADISNDAAFFAARRIGASTGIALTFGTAAAWSTAAATEKMRIAGNGNVGINNTNPLRKLDVVGDASGNGIRVTGTTGTIGAFTAEGTSVNIQADSAAATRVLVDGGSSNASGSVVLNGGSSGYVQLSTGGTARLQAFANGTVSVPGTLVVNSGASPAGSARNITISTSAPSGGADGDVWLQYTA